MHTCNDIEHKFGNLGHTDLKSHNGRKAMGCRDQEVKGLPEAKRDMKH